MKTRNIWLTAIVFGLFAAGVLYFSIYNENQPASTTVTEEVDPEKAEVKNDESKQTVNGNRSENSDEGNTMLPVTDGKRAISIEVNVVQGVSGFIKQGSFVDLVSITRLPEDKEVAKNQHEAAQILLQNVKVLAIGHSADTNLEAARYQTVTLEVTPREGLALGFATKGELYLMLRNPGDEKLEKEHLHIHEDELHQGVYK